MSDLVFIAFDSEQKAEEVREKILAMQKEYLIELGDAVVAVKDVNGRIKLNQLINTNRRDLRRILGHVDRPDIPQSIAWHGNRCGFWRARRETDRRRYQRRLHEECGRRVEARDGGIVSAGSEDDDGQGPGRPERRWRDCDPHVF